ncbi:hypothetical protein CDAR_374111 [Caerostris darwini]|uniref:Uncharacterized protein n=1 Tax=Caerostris darwini TaxID=1538125 RepID=A0AAV4P1Y6_9ARAC|nr:hypothetical protein CDAR_374111 [Caerostris darwini]
MELLIDDVLHKLACMHCFIKEFYVKPSVEYRKMIRMICQAVWTKPMIYAELQLNFFMDFYHQMRDSPEKYLTYIIYACNLIAENEPNVFQRFIDIIAVINIITFYFAANMHPNFFKYSQQILNAFFDKGFEKAFEKQGGYKKLLKYINLRGYNACFEEMKNLYAEGDQMTPIVYNIRLSMTAEQYKNPLCYAVRPFDEKEAESHEFSVSLAREILSLPVNRKQDVIIDAISRISQDRYKKSVITLLTNSACVTKYLVPYIHSLQYFYVLSDLPKSSCETNTEETNPNRAKDGGSNASTSRPGQSQPTDLSSFKDNNLTFFSSNSTTKYDQAPPPFYISYKVLQLAILTAFEESVCDS